MPDENNHPYLKWVVTIAVLLLVTHQVYSGLALRKVGIPGLLELEFADNSNNNDNKDSGKNTSDAELQPAKPTPACAERTADVGPIKLTTNSGNTRIAAGDNEIDSDDWTSVKLTYSVTKANANRQLKLTLNWDAQERNRNKSKGDTRFTSSKTFTLFSVESNCPGSVIKKISGLNTAGKREEYFRGKVHGFAPFPNTGSLENIKVQFDGKGRHDEQRQALEADLARFTVLLSASD